MGKSKRKPKDHLKSSAMDAALDAMGTSNMSEIEQLNLMYSAVEADYSESQQKKAGPSRKSAGKKKRGGKRRRRKVPKIDDSNQARLMALGLGDAAIQGHENAKNQQHAAGVKKKTVGIQGQHRGMVDIPEDDQIMEYLAHVATYKNLAEMDETEKEELAQELKKRGYEMPNLIDCEETDFQAMSFLPIKGSGRDPIMSFRGTESLQDVATDLDESGVGTTQFVHNRDKIESELRRIQEVTGLKAKVTGHSLGGALSQRSAVEFPDLIAGGATYQSAGIAKHHLNDYKPGTDNQGNPSTLNHHYSSDDIVHKTGAHLPGNNYSYDTHRNIPRGNATRPIIDAANIIGAHRSMLTDGSHRVNQDFYHPSRDSSMVEKSRKNVGIGAREMNDWIFDHPFNPRILGDSSLLIAELMAEFSSNNVSRNLNQYIGGHGQSKTTEEPGRQVIERAKKVEEREHQQQQLKEIMKAHKGSGQVDFLDTD